jgi:nicotinamide-nucleotide amidase
LAPTLARVTVELINTGSELLLGRILNTHQQWLGRKLADLGLPLTRQIAVADVAPDIEEAVRQALGRADLVITTGGLGPTSDDLTRERLAGLLGRPLRHRAEVEANIRAFFESRGRAMPERTKVEALVPEGALVLSNHHGTAPGLAIDVNPNPFRLDGRRAWLVLLPGPPRELQPMFCEQVAPLLEREFPASESFVCRTFKTTGIGESLLEERLLGPIAPLMSAGLEVGYCARVGEVEVRFAARGGRASDLVSEAGSRLAQAAGEFIFGTDDDALESVVVREFSARGLTLALAESCTGGHVANRITNIPGASAVLLAGWVTYANAAKTRLLGVPADLIAAEGAVSAPVARAMAEGARRLAGADYAVSITGIAGPAGGTETKPVGTVFIGLAGPAGTGVTRHLNRFDRDTFKYLTTQQALDALRRQAFPDRLV